MYVCMYVQANSGKQGAISTKHITYNLDINTVFNNSSQDR